MAFVRRLLTIWCFILLVHTVYAQYENVWIFGNSAGLDFNSGLPVPVNSYNYLANNSMGPASVCNRHGALLFYTDGHEVWDKEHAMMPNGTNLTGYTDPSTHKLISMSLIVPFPDNADRYYIFSLRGGYSVGYFPEHGSLYYSVVDLTLNGGKGDIVPGSKGIFVDSGLAGRLTAIPGERCNIWVVALRHPDVDTQFRAYSVSAAGVNTTPVISPVSAYRSHGNSFEDITVSPDGTKIASFVFAGGTRIGMELYNFNKATGVVSTTSLKVTGFHGGGAFSPDNTKLYANKYNDGIYQYDLTVTNPVGVKVHNNNISGFTYLKLAPNGKIYFRSTNARVLGAIDFPNLAGTACQYVENAVTLLPGTSADEKFPNVVPVMIRDTAAKNSREVTICFSDSAELQADAGGFDYFWSNGAAGATTVVRSSGIYIASWFTAPCIYHEDTFKVTFVGIPLQTGFVNGCENGVGSKAWIMPAAGDATTYSYVWQDAGGNTLRIHTGSSGDTLLNILPGTYTVRVSTANGCTISYTINVPLPVFQVAFTSDTAACQSDPVQFQNTSSPDFNAFTWYFGDGDTTTEANPIHQYQQPGIYHVRLVGTNVNGCMDTAYTTIMLDSLPVVFFTADKDSICAGDYIQLQPFATIGFTSLQWLANGLAAPVNGVYRQRFDEGGIHVITLIGAYPHCPDTSFSDTIIIFAHPVVNIGKDTTLCPGAGQIELANQHTIDPSSVYEWSTGAATHTIIVQNPGEYWLKVTSGNNCVTADTIVVARSCYIDIPNVFTPDGDGINDYFFPRNILSKGLSGFSMRIYNRIGQLIFETTDIGSRGWDGRYDGVDQPQGVYIYVMEAGFINGTSEQRQGNVTLLR